MATVSLRINKQAAQHPKAAYGLYKEIYFYIYIYGGEEREAGHNHCQECEGGKTRGVATNKVISRHKYRGSPSNSFSLIK